MLDSAYQTKSFQIETPDLWPDLSKPSLIALEQNKPSPWPTIPNQTEPLKDSTKKYPLTYPSTAPITHHPGPKIYPPWNLPTTLGHTPIGLIGK